MTGRPVRRPAVERSCVRPSGPRAGAKVAGTTRTLEFARSDSRGTRTVALCFPQSSIGAVRLCRDILIPDRVIRNSGRRAPGDGRPFSFASFHLEGIRIRLSGSTTRLLAGRERMAFRSRVLRRRARGAGRPRRRRAARRLSHALARRARAALPASPLAVPARTSGASPKVRSVRRGWRGGACVPAGAATRAVVGRAGVLAGFGIADVRRYFLRVPGIQFGGHSRPSVMPPRQPPPPLARSGRIRREYRHITAIVN